MEASLKFHSLLSFTLILAFSSLCASDSDFGFTTELVHRDSPRSPYYNPADTPYQRMAGAIRRSVSRANRLSLSGVQSTPSAAIVANNGEYLMNISLGSPPSPIVAIADTGSDLIWTQCKPCTSCFKQDTPLFEPRKSKTYRDVPCRGQLCGLVDGTSCGGRICQYSYSYGDNSYTNGNVATETITLASTSGRPVRFPSMIFGCGFDNGGNFDEHTSGIIGLGGGDASLTTQLRKVTGGKFSYCLPPYSSGPGHSSKLNFGANAVVAGRGVVSTPLIQGDVKTFYYLTLEAISVGRTRIEFPSGESGASNVEGNIIIDSGTTLTLLPQDFFDEIKAVMVKFVKLPSAEDPSQFLNLCYRTRKDTGLGIPTLTFHFKGADVVHDPGSVFVRIADDIICFALNPYETSIYGNLAQINHLIGYDTVNKKLSFKPVDCTLH